MPLSLHEIAEKAVIRFPWSINPDQSVDLVRHIGRSINGIVEFDVSNRHIVIGKEPGYNASPKEKETKLEKKAGLRHVRGTIEIPSYSSAKEEFMFKPYKQTRVRFSSLKFIPKEDGEDYSGMVKVWDEVRNAVNSYFEG